MIDSVRERSCISTVVDRARVASRFQCTKNLGARTWLLFVWPSALLRVSFVLGLVSPKQPREASFYQYPSADIQTAYMSKEKKRKIKKKWEIASALVVVDDAVDAFCLNLFLGPLCQPIAYWSFDWQLIAEILKHRFLASDVFTPERTIENVGWQSRDRPKPSPAPPLKRRDDFTKFYGWNCTWRLTQA